MGVWTAALYAWLFPPPLVIRCAEDDAAGGLRQTDTKSGVDDDDDTSTATRTLFSVYDIVLYNVNGWGKLLRVYEPPPPPEMELFCHGQP